MGQPTREQILQNFESTERALSPFAVTRASSKGREQTETDVHDFVTPYQVDRQRILIPMRSGV